VPGRDAVDFVLHRAGVGIDIDAGGLIFRHFLKAWFGPACTPSGGKLRAKR
jgi:hypothetical protein